MGTFPKPLIRAGFAVFVLSFSLIPVGCDEGLMPLNESSGFSGKITFKNWPPPDSARNMRLVAFTDVPTDSSGLIIAYVNRRAVIYPPIANGPGLARFLDTLDYSFTSDSTGLQPNTYNYVVVAVQFGPSVWTDWEPVGVYSTTPGSLVPAPVNVLLHKMTPGVDIAVDFHHKPPKPWR
jgi:hypothetical protein